MDRAVSVDDAQVKGIVFNIQHYSVHDGSGIRTIVFLKGCPLRCRWCGNPESQALLPQLARNEGRCLGSDVCDYCQTVCPNAALLVAAQGVPIVDRERCAGCMACAVACPTQALQPYGTEQTVAQVIDAVERDQPFYVRSGGGITLSGGEPLLQAEFALALLRESKRRRMDCALETCGQVPWPVLAEACGLLREIFFDVKLADPASHKAHTGADNSRILANLRRMIETFPDLDICIRTPVVPGVNDSLDEIGAVLDLLEPFPQVRYELLPYHRLGAQKYQFLDQPFVMGEAALDDARWQELRALVKTRRGRGSDRAAIA